MLANNLLASRVENCMSNSFFEFILGEILAGHLDLRQLHEIHLPGLDGSVESLNYDDFLDLNFVV